MINGGDRLLSVDTYRIIIVPVHDQNRNVRTVTISFYNVYTTSQNFRFRIVHEYESRIIIIDKACKYDECDRHYNRNGRK